MIINKRLAREYALSCASKRAHKFTRVGRSFYTMCDTALRNEIATYIHSLPSKGKTIK